MSPFPPALQQVARLINADAKEIIFTSGATESNNIAIKGVAKFYGQKKNHVITTQTEHKCVLDSCRFLEDDGFEVTYLPVERNGLVNMQVRGLITGWRGGRGRGGRGTCVALLLAERPTGGFSRMCLGFGYIHMTAW
jgi:hypothetical protein